MYLNQKETGEWLAHVVVVVRFERTHRFDELVSYVVNELFSINMVYHVEHSLTIESKKGHQQQQQQQQQ